MDIKIKNVIIGTPCSDETNLLAIRGEFDIFICFT